MGGVMKRYNGWLTLHFGKKRKDDTVDDAIAEKAAPLSHSRRRPNSLTIVADDLPGRQQIHGWLFAV